jgi:hypothetical protein
MSKMVTPNNGRCDLRPSAPAEQLLVAFSRIEGKRNNVLPRTARGGQEGGGEGPDSVVRKAVSIGWEWRDAAPSGKALNPEGE